MRNSENSHILEDKPAGNSKRKKMKVIGRNDKGKRKCPVRSNALRDQELGEMKDDVW